MRRPASLMVASGPSDAARKLAVTLLARATLPPDSSNDAGSELLATVVDVAAASAAQRAPAAKGGLVDSLLSARGCLTLARGVWADVLRAGDTAIDATCGNGHDASDIAALLAQRAAQSSAGEPAAGRLIALDVQPAAVDATRARVSEALRGCGGPLPAVEVLLQDHSSFPASLPPGSVRLVVYNLGYLPGGGDHGRTTTAESTIRSLRAAQELLAVGGAMTIMCYPAHPEGRVEAEAVHAHLATLDKHRWRVLVCRPNQNTSEKFLVVALRRRPEEELSCSESL